MTSLLRVANLVTQFESADSVTKAVRDVSFEIRPGEIPVFWACGVTPQLVLQNARPSICITHTPGAMLIGDQASDAVSMRWSA